MFALRLIPKAVRRLLLLTAAACLGAVGLPSGASAATCSQFPNQAAAQAAANTVDADGDGIYCESLPCPCSTAKPGSTPAPAPVDSDGDGVLDGQDQCVSQAGPAPSGCPPPADSDGDGVPDTADACPNQPAATSSGCPPVVPATSPTPAPAPAVAAAARTSDNTTVLCLPAKSSSGRVARRKPASCTTLGPSDAFAQAANLAKLKWHGWGTLQATATGIEKGFHLPFEHTKVRVTLSRPKANDCGGFSYTRLKVTSKYGSLRQNLPAVCDEND